MVDMSTTRFTLGRALGTWWGKLTFFASAVSYWFLYAFSAGVVFYYSYDLTPLLSQLSAAGVPNPHYIVYATRGFMGFYYSGVVWFPTNHLQLNLLFGPTLFSILLSVLFGLNMALLGYSFSSRSKTRTLGLNGLVGIIPTLFTGGCCTLPFGTILLSYFFPLAAGPSILSGLEFNYAPLMDSFLAGLMLFVLVRSANKLGCCVVEAHE